MGAPVDPLAVFPLTLRHGMQQPDVVYRRSKELFAIAADASTDAPSAIERSLRTDSGQRLDVFRGQASGKGGTVLAVYADAASGRTVVPTGRIFVRFKEPVQAESRRAALQAAGYRIAALVSYAPHTAWVEAGSGDAAQALKGIGKLEALPDIENVEPQWLSERAAK